MRSIHVKSHCYQFYGLTVSSDIPLTPLPPYSGTVEEVDVVISSASVSTKGLTNTSTKALYCYARPNSVYLRIPGIAAFYMEDGKRIDYQVENGASIELVALFIQSHCVPLILLQRGYIVLRGSAIKNADSCVVLAMADGAFDKSCLTFSLLKDNIDVLCDDFCVIDHDNCVLPGYGYIKVWHKALLEMGENPSDYKKIATGVNKYIYPLNDNFYRSRLPIKHIYVVDLAYNTNDIKTFLLKKSLTKFKFIKSVRYRPQYAIALGVELDTSEQLFNISSQVPVTTFYARIASTTMKSVKQGLVSDALC